MEDVNISKYRAQVVRAGSTPASPGFVVSEGQDPVNPSGSSNYVPYSGAISNVDFGEFGLDTGFVTLDTTPTNIPTEQGGIYWDDSRSTAALIMNGTLQHIGQDTFFYVKNSTGSSIPKGTAVRFNGTDGASGHLLIAPFLANGTYPSNYFMGVTAEAIANGSFGQVMHFGELTGVNTSGYTAGALLYASTSVAGAFQTTAPVAPNNIVLVAAAINSTNNGTILVRPTYGSNINQDEGVKITSGTTGDLLQLQAGGLWENKTLAQVIGSAYVPSTRTITINGTTQDLSANRTYNVGTVTAVTASSPLASSGGTTPNITIQQASGSQSGFLSSTDWTTFNGKQNALNGTGFVKASGTTISYDNTNYLPLTGGTLTGSLIVENNAITQDGTRPIITLQQSGTTKVFLGISTGSSDLVNGDNSGDAVFRKPASSGAYRFSVDGGSSSALIINSNGNLLVGTTTDAGFKLDVNGTGRFSGNVVLGTTALSGGGAAQWITANGTPYGGGFITSVSGVAKGYYYYDNGANAAVVQGAAGVGVQLLANNTVALSIASTGAATFSSSVTAGGALTISYANARASVNSTTTTNSAYMSFSNSVTGYVGLDNSAGTDFGNGAYSMNIFNGGAYNLNLGTSNVTRLTITSGGNVLIGTTTDNGNKLQVNGRIYANGLRASGSIFGFFQNYTGSFEWEIGSDSFVGTGMYMYNSSNGYVFRLTAAGVLTTSGGGTSDRRTKEDINPINESVLPFINELNPVSFKFINDVNKKTRRGFIAQEVLETSIPSLVLGDGDKQGGTYGLDYDGILALAIKAIQEQQVIINDLKQKIS